MPEPVNSVTAQAEMEHQPENITHKPLSENNWQGFDQIPLTPIESRYVTQILIETGAVALFFITVMSSFLIIGAEIPLLIMAVIIPGLFFIATFIIWLRVSHARSIAYSVCEHELLMQKGIIWFKRISLPYTRLQHISLSQGPLERKFGLKTLKCFSAGSGSAEIELPGLESKTAERLRQHLLSMAGKASQSSEPLSPEADQYSEQQHQEQMPADSQRENQTESQIDTDNHIVSQPEKTADNDKR
ncbi:MAG: membrane protein YdbS with pleckstrin-like domain [Shewanella sp.]|jgi:membrane protein YdbS with pleckstrin-like domain